MKREDLFRTNPLFWALNGSTDFVPAYTHIKEEHFQPAINFALGELRRNIKKITNNPEAPTFQNTIEMLEFAHARYNHLQNIFDHLANVRRTPRMEKLEKKFETQKAAYTDDLRFNTALFKRIKSLYNQKEKLGLDPEQSALLDTTYHDFFMNGAALAQPKKKQLYAINQTLAKLGSEYDTLMLKYTESGEITVFKREDLAGLSQKLISDAAKLAVKKGQKGQWIFSGDDDTWWEMIISAKSRALRKRLFEPTVEGYLHICVMEKIIKQILNLRYDRARLLGYRSHTEYKLNNRMINSKKEITDFLDDLRRHATPVARHENALIKAAANADGVRKVERYDRYYYEERIKESELGLGDKKLRPYFSINNVVAGACALSEELFDLSFVKNDMIEKWHEDVECYDVIDKRTGQKTAIVMMDLYTRKEKAGHAWCGTTSNAGMLEGKNAIPVVTLVCNLKKSTTDEPTLATPQSVRTFFHEFGHGIQAILTRTRYQSLSGFNNIPLDLIELFSQVYENWSVEPAVLDRYAAHYKTGKPLPNALKTKIQGSSGFMGGNSIKFALEVTYLDLALHSRSLKKINVETYEHNYLGKMFPGRSRQGVITPIFQHIATYGYDAGYYSYIWSEALDADAFQLFREKGIFDKQTAGKLRTFMENAAIQDASSNYIAFRGRPVSSEPLLARYKLSHGFNQAAANSITQDNIAQTQHTARKRTLAL